MPDINRRLMIGVVGLGSMGKRYLSYLSDYHQASVAIYDHNPDVVSDVVKQRQGDISNVILDCSSFSELLDLDPRVLIVATPARDHLSALRETRDRHPNCSVLVEKPLSDVPISDDELRWGLFQSTRGLISVGYNWRFHSFARHLRTARFFIRDLTLCVSSDMRQWPGKDYCDPLREFSHEIDLVRYLTSGPGFEDVRMTPTGRFIIDGTHHQGRWHVRVDPYHEPSRRWVRATMMDGSIIKYIWERTPEVIERMYRFQLRELLDATLNNETSEALTCNLADALGTSLLIDEIAERLEMNETESGVVM
jgi:hypothetical protein